MKLVLSILSLCSIINVHGQLKNLTNDLDFGFSLGADLPSVRFATNGPDTEFIPFLGPSLGINVKKSEPKNLHYVAYLSTSLNSSALVSLDGNSNASWYFAPGHRVNLGSNVYKGFSERKMIPLLFAGGNLTVPLPRQKLKNCEFTVQSNIQLQAGLAYQIKLKHFTFQPELAWQHGLRNVNLNPVFERVYAHNVALTLRFFDQR